MGGTRVSRSVLRGFNAARFEKARTDAKLSRGTLAQLADIRSDETVRRWEAGLSNPQVDVLRRALIALNVELHRLGEPMVSVDELIQIPESDRLLSDWRCLRLLTQPELAARAGIPTASLTKIEANERPLSDEAAERLSRALELPESAIREGYARGKIAAAVTKAPPTGH
ncbi:helix-turn-helix domain-containing protein [Nocardia vermiculata]|uniref:Helix-turn-helix transcriptional regulator n=1 Tax=Nocardia vermiculata TaxID=257274 RepID=A0A846Y6H7_9NOCA|nr:helix-turn-helix transcriptional regulator [Nocardia vermiculata]NKY53945.1 helix-turn-helix transcriptional regulator [Nocardia vermiculata]